MNWLEVGELPFGDRLDRLIEAIAAASPGDSPYTRLGGSCSITLKPHRAATIQCRIGAKPDVRWMIEVLGPPTRAIPGVAMAWEFHA